MPPRKKILGIDLMGGDTPPEEILTSLSQVCLPSGIDLLLFGSPSLAATSPFPYHITKEVIAMEDPPLQALRKKKDSSLLVALRHLQRREIDALISMGNTGALVSGAKTVLSTAKTIKRPALLTTLPTKKHPVLLLDVGASPTAKASHLVDFAKMGLAYLTALGRKSPKFGLLNIGTEPSKGTEEHQKAYRALSTWPGFVGNIEGTSLFEGEVDCVVTDGFTGNVVLKTAEGMGNWIQHRLQELCTEKDFSSVRKQLHYAEYPGAILLGVLQPVIKCHGRSSAQALLSAIEGTSSLLEREVLSQFLENLL